MEIGRSKLGADPVIRTLAAARTLSGALPTKVIFPMVGRPLLRRSYSRTKSNPGSIGFAVCCCSAPSCCLPCSRSEFLCLSGWSSPCPPRCAYMGIMVPTNKKTADVPVTFTNFMDDRFLSLASRHVDGQRGRRPQLTQSSWPISCAEN